MTNYIIKSLQNNFEINLVNEFLLLAEGPPPSENGQRGESMWNPGFLSKVSHQQQ